MLLPLDVAILQTYTLPSFDLTYHAPGFITVRNFQSRLHPSILLSHAHSPCLPAIKKIFPLDDKGERESCQMEEQAITVDRVDGKGAGKTLIKTISVSI